MEQKTRVPPAKGLKTLTWYQVEQIDQHVQELCEAGDSEVTITVTRKRPLFISVRRRHNLKPTRA